MKEKGRRKRNIITVVILLIPWFFFCLGEVMYYSADLRSLGVAFLILLICFPIMLFSAHLFYPKTLSFSESISFKGHLPTILTMLIPISFIFGFLLISCNNLSSLNVFLKALFILILVLPLWLLFGHMFFPRIVVTIQDLDIFGKFEGELPIKLVVDGREILVKNVDEQTRTPFQFCIQVWRRAIYDVYLTVEKENVGIKPMSKKANTYEHDVYHITFPDVERNI